MGKAWLFPRHGELFFDGATGPSTDDASARFRFLVQVVLSELADRAIDMVDSSDDSSDFEESEASAAGDLPPQPKVLPRAVFPSDAHHWNKSKSSMEVADVQSALVSMGVDGSYWRGRSLVAIQGVLSHVTEPWASTSHAGGRGTKRAKNN